MGRKFAAQRTVRRTGEYLRYGVPRYGGKYPVRGSVPSFMRRLSVNGVNTTVDVVGTGDGLPTVYKHIYPRRGRYRKRYILNGGKGPMRVKGLRRFVTSFSAGVGLSHRFLPRGAHNEITIVNSNPTKLAMTNSLTERKFGMAVFRKRTRPNNMLVCNVPRCHLPGAIIHSRIDGVTTLNIRFVAGYVINRGAIAVSDLFHTNCSTVFVNANADIPRGVSSAPNDGLRNMDRDACFLRGMGTCGRNTLPHSVIPLHSNRGMNMVNNKGITVSTTHATVHLNTSIAMLCEGARRRVPTVGDRCRSTMGRNIGFR